MMDSKILILVVLAFVCIVYAISSMVSNHKSRFCKHKVLDGVKIINGQCKCVLCEAERQQKLLKEQQMELRKINVARYKSMKAQAWERYKSRLPYRLSSIDQMTGFQFEKYCAKLLTRMGYKVSLTKKTGDGGKDAFAWKDNQKYLVECKRYSGDQKIDRPKLQKLFAAMNEEQVTEGIFMATCSYTKDALAYGEKFHIRTIDREELLSLATDCVTESDREITYMLCCPECGEEVQFCFFGDKMIKHCTNGHQVPGMFVKEELHRFNPNEKGIMA